jgi:hypothetical protein
VKSKISIGPIAFPGNGLFQKVRTMRHLLRCVIFLNLLAGCKPSPEPVGSRPAPDELCGKWTLANSPQLSGNPPVSIPSRGNSSILLGSNHVATLTNVLVEEIQPEKKPWPYVMTLKTEAASWDIEERQGLWSVQIDFQNNQSILLPIRRRGEGEYELSYQPDPERNSFIYTRDRGKSK